MFKRFQPFMRNVSGSHWLSLAPSVLDINVSHLAIQHHVNWIGLRKLEGFDHPHTDEFLIIEIEAGRTIADIDAAKLDKETVVWREHVLMERLTLKPPLIRAKCDNSEGGA